MQWSSKSIAKLAAALAKAQAELVNPEKSLVATMSSDGTGEPGRSFRYASLASGLEIVRKTLSQHAIAAVQTTAIDEGADIVKLTTVLAHSSGEWIASDWPVCAVGETATPHRMGAALTYARRYGLFTLVGIAGEDDLDAPDLIAPTNKPSQPERPKASSNGRNGGQLNRGPQTPLRRRDRAKSNKSILEPAASAELRDRLLAELNDFGSADDAALWAHRNLGAKNDLTAGDAVQVEEAFRARLAALESAAREAPQQPRAKSKRPSPGRRTSGKPNGWPRSTAIDKSMLAIPEPRRIRDRDHVKSVARQPCLICGRQPADAHHLRFAQHPALGRKVSDEFTVPLCRGHHREVHRCGDEQAWWKNAGVDPTVLARALWLETHPLPTASDKLGTDDATSVPPLPTMRETAGMIGRSANEAQVTTKPLEKSDSHDRV